MADREDVELIAELVGKTSAHMKKIDGEIISSSANLQQSQDAWDPHKILAYSKDPPRLPLNNGPSKHMFHRLCNRHRSRIHSLSCRL